MDIHDLVQQQSVRVCAWAHVRMCVSLVYLLAVLCREGTEEKEGLAELVNSTPHDQCTKGVFIDNNGEGRCQHKELLDSSSRMCEFQV